MEKRKNKRIEYDAYAEVFDEYRDIMVSADVKNISPDGTAILIDEPFDIGTDIRMELMKYRQDGLDPIVNNVSGKIVRLDREGTRWLQAVLFNELDEDDEDNLKNTIYS